jgi:hypothetical protein
MNMNGNETTIKKGCADVVMADEYEWTQDNN